MNYIKQFLDKKNILLFVFLLSGSVQSQNLLNGPNDIVFDSLNNRYIVSNWAGNSIVAIDSLGNQSYFLNNVSHAHGMEIKDSILFVASFHNLLLLNLSSASIIASIYVSGSEYLGHIAIDSTNYVYITDWSARKLFRININDQTTMMLHTFTQIPVGISYEENNNRLILLTLTDNASILAYNLAGGNIDTVISTNIDDPDAICKDLNGNYYLTSFSENIVYRFNGDFSSSPEIISTGHGGPSGICYNITDNIIGVTNYNFNTISLIQLDPNNVEFDINFEPADYILFQNYPNPFNPSTTVSFSIPLESFVTLKVYDVLGNDIATLVNEEKSAGSYEVRFDGAGLPSGIYFYQLKADSYSATKKMLLLK